MVLIQISLGYPLVKGRLHTRYAPVRRSQATEVTLPLDLHVLGLPLAFILSQDQTLHRMFFIFFDVAFKTVFSYALTLFFCQSNMSMNLSSYLSPSLGKRLQN